MKIKMPDVGDLPTARPESCELLLVRRADSSDYVCTCIIGEFEVIYFESSSISYSDRTWFNDNYVVIREYATGESMTITK